MRNSRILVWLTTLALVACGGGGSDSSSFASSASSSGTAASGAVASVVVQSNVASIPSDNSVAATITAIVRDANNLALPNVTVAPSTSAGLLAPVVATAGTANVTDASGSVKYSLTLVGTPTPTSITVTITAGSFSGKATVAVTNTQRTISVVTSLSQIPSDASKSATITALVLDANNNVVSGAPVSIVSNSGALTITQAQTDSSGSAKATLSAGTDPTNRAITVTATSGTATATVQVFVTGTTLTLSGPTNLVQNSTGTFVAQLTNSAGQPTPPQTVTLTSANHNTVSQPVITDANGRASFTVTGTVGGIDTLTASALGLTQQAKLTVSTQNFTITSPANNSKVNLGTSQVVTATWTSGGAPVVGSAVTFAATRGTVVPATPVTTDANGRASISISSTSAGPSIISASGNGVSAQVTLDFVAVTPSQISVQPGPASIAVGGTSTITATVRDAANNLVEGATVDFQVATDPTNGGLSAASVVTNAQGVAQVQYTAGNTSSGANGVSVTATVHATAITGSTNLTVGGQTVFLSFGTGNTIDTSQGTAIYQITYTVFAVDSGGAALANAPVTMKVLPVAYGKGVLAGCPGGTYWGPSYSTLAADADAYNGTRMCKNEDSDNTGNINSLGVVGGIPVKDYNANGKLDPGNVAVVAPSSGVTDSNGRLNVTVTYPRDHAYWAAVALTASTTVQGTESSTTATFVLQGALSDYACAIGPPGPVSPYGTATTCANPN